MDIHPDLVEVLEGLEKGEVPPTIGPWTRIMAQKLGRPEDYYLGVRVENQGKAEYQVMHGVRERLKTLTPEEFEKLFWSVNEALLEGEEEVDGEKAKWGVLLAPFKVKELEEKLHRKEERCNTLQSEVFRLESEVARLEAELAASNDEAENGDEADLDLDEE